MKFFKKMMAMLLVLSCCFSMSTTAFAADADVDFYSNIEATETSVTPRIGMAGYRNYYHNGSTISGTYTISTDSLLLPLRQTTIELYGFNSDTWVMVEIYNSLGTALYTLDVTGNGKWENKPLNSVHFINGDTYTVRYQVFNYNTPNNGDDGWIGIWIY